MLFLETVKIVQRSFDWERQKEKLSRLIHKIKRDRKKSKQVFIIQKHTTKLSKKHRKGQQKDNKLAFGKQNKLFDFSVKR